MDYQILIENVEDPVKYGILNDYHMESIKDHGSECVNKFFKMDDIKDILSGVGRIVFYKNNLEWD